MAMAKFKDRKNDVLSMAAERMEPEEVKPTFQPVKFSPPPHESTKELVTQTSLDNASVSSEDFYDAEDAPSHVLDTQTGPSSGATVEYEIVEEGDDEGNGDMGGVMAENKSVILHILSQIRVGMDLSRFALPAFLLAPRSILQMYASLFGRPNMITEVASHSTPKGRMISLVKWFLGALSSSRRDPAPKKPYNPVLGETFICYWDIPDMENTHGQDDLERMLVKTGPFPQAGPNSFCFLSEQVSHHPPVSALYAECAAQRMTVSATICSKPRLTPTLAVKAHNTGVFKVNLLEHDEEYVTPLPHGYVRGILTHPWFEFGGECFVECAKSGHSAKIIFHAKPFRGGRKHRVSGELKHKSEKKPYLTFDGEWDSVIYSRTDDGPPEPFFDASTPTHPKKLKKLSCADPTDSRLVWKHLTEAILADNDHAAADAKHQVEEAQREKVRERNRTGEVFSQQYFHQSKDDPSVWEFNSPLSDRLNTLR